MATYNFTVRAKDESGAFADREFNIEVKNTMVDRILAITNNDGFASTDGKTWTQRAGIGGQWCDNLLGKWIVAINDTTYRISEDTLNWVEGLEFKLANQPPVMGIDETTEEEVIVEEAGPFYGKPFTVRRKSFSVFNGQVYVVADIEGKTGLVRSSNLKEWYLVVGENYQETHDNYFGVTLDHSVANALWHWSGIERHNGQYVILNGISKEFIVTTDMGTFNTVKPNNHDVLNNILSAFRQSSMGSKIDLMSINGILFINSVTSSYTNSSGYRERNTSRRYYTIDLNDIAVPITNEIVINTRERGVPMTTALYVNGYLLTFAYGKYTITDRPTDMSSVNSANNHYRDIGVLDGVVYAIRGNILTTVTPGEAPVDFIAEGLPASGIVSIGAM